MAKIYIDWQNFSYEEIQSSLEILVQIYLRYWFKFTWNIDSNSLEILVQIHLKYWFKFTWNISSNSLEILVQIYFLMYKFVYEIKKTVFPVWSIFSHIEL